MPTVKLCSFDIGTDQRELVSRGTPMFPCASYVSVIGEGLTENIPWHWHQEVEVLAVLRGAMRLEIPGQSFEIQAGEGAFINTSVLQTMESTGGGPCEIRSFVLHHSVLSGALESVFEQRYVRPLLRCAQLPAIHFRRDVGWHREAVACVHAAFGLYQGEPFGYELLVRSHLSRLWHLVVTHNRAFLAQQGESRDRNAQRVKDMLAYIHTHYADPIGLQDIAGAGAVSDRECQRCFRGTIGMTPVQYLLRHRVSVAAGLLAGSDKSVTEVSDLAGFESPSYFAHIFKRLVEMSPRQYRHAMAAQQQGR